MTIRESSDDRRGGRAARFSSRVVAAAIVLAATAGAAPPDPAQTAREIRTEACRGNQDPAGRPLPLAGHWNTGLHDPAKEMAPAFQISLVERGHHVLPSFRLPPPWAGEAQPDAKQMAYYEAAIKRAAELKLPISFVVVQFEAGLTKDKAFFRLPPGKNPNVLTPDGKILKKLSPFGPVEPWRRIGRQWTARPLVARLQQLYPDPPKVLMVSNNEHTLLRWYEAEKQSKRYLDTCGRGKDDMFKRRVMAEGWIERYRALQAGMREGLTAPAWKSNSIFIGYDAFGPGQLGRWDGWMASTRITDKFTDPSPLIWDGGSPSYYVHDWNACTDYTVWSPQIESMNWPFMLAEALKLNPRFWWEISVWDGHRIGQDTDMRKVYARRGQTFTPRRYGGFVQFGMWLLRPRLVREFRGWPETRKDIMPYYRVILDAVDRVHADPALAAFWRKGRLVPVRDRRHPYQHDIPAKYKDVDRWFLLKTNLTPPRPWKLDTPIPVFAVALELGKGHARRWLIYAHSPLADRKGVQITVPGYGRVTTDVPVGGMFLFID